MKKLAILITLILTISGCASADVEDNETSDETMATEEMTENEVVPETEESSDSKEMEEESVTEEEMDQPAAEVEEMEEPEADSSVFTAESLAEFDGMDGSRAYIAIEGIVYDVTDNPLWSEGLHQGRFQAGQDLTEDMKKAPHGLTKLGGVEEVGTYEGE